jgi:hypothetical protein
VRWELQVYECVRGDGADRDAFYVGRELQIRSGQKSEQVRDGGSAGEGDRVGEGRGASEKVADQGDGILWNDGAVGGRDGDFSAGFPQGLREDVAGLFGADEEEAGRRSVELSDVG